MSTYGQSKDEIAKRERDQAEMREFARKLDNPGRGPCPVDKHLKNMSLTELELFERWAGIPVSNEERMRRQRLRREAADRDQKI